MKRSFGWIRDEKDERDLKFSPAPIMEMPEEINLIHMNPEVYNQLSLGSCVFNAEGSMIQDRLKKQGQDFVPSRLFNYYNVREQYGKVHDDCGATMRDGIKAYVKFGVPPEKTWPYDIKKFAVKPPAECYQHALNHQTVEYNSIEQNLIYLKSCLATGNSFVGGIDIYDSFMLDVVRRTGIIPIPNVFTERHLGGHAVKFIGYFEKLRSFLCKNSWGESWGMHGHFLIPYSYVLDKKLASDFWTITLVETDL